MKYSNQRWLLILVISLATASCKKELDFVRDGYNQPDAQCLVLHTEDDFFAVPIDIFYNKKGNPDSLNVSGTPIITTYDHRDRLIKVAYLNGLADFHDDFEYKDHSFLPSVISTYDSYFGGYIGIDSFYFNPLGEMKRVTHTNLLYPQFNSEEIYTYDNHFNVRKVILQSANGGTEFVPGFTEYEATKYDDKLNFMSGNQWIKYILRNAGIDGYSWMMFSVNNAVDWNYGYQGGYNPVRSTFVYDAQGFATKVNLSLFDQAGVTDELDFSRTSSSTCDIVPGIKKSQYTQLQAKPKSFAVPVNIRHLPSPLRSN